LSSWHFTLFHEEDAQSKNPQVDISIYCITDSRNLPSLLWTASMLQRKKSCSQQWPPILWISSVIIIINKNKFSCPIWQSPQPKAHYHKRFKLLLQQSKQREITTLTELSSLIYTEIINHWYLRKVCFLMSLLLSNQFHLCPPCACLHSFPTPFSISSQSRSLCLVPYLNSDHHVR